MYPPIYSFSQNKYEEKCAEIKYLQSELELTCAEKSELKQRVLELEKTVKDLGNTGKENAPMSNLKIPDDLIERLRVNLSKIEFFV